MSTLNRLDVQRNKDYLFEVFCEVTLSPKCDEPVCLQTIRSTTDYNIRLWIYSTCIDWTTSVQPVVFRVSPQSAADSLAWLYLCCSCWPFSCRMCFSSSHRMLLQEPRRPRGGPNNNNNLTLSYIKSSRCGTYVKTKLFLLNLER